FLQQPDIFATLPLHVRRLDDGLQKLVRREERRSPRFRQSRVLCNAFLEELFDLLKVRRVGLDTFLVMLFLFDEDTELEVRLFDCVVKKGLVLLAVCQTGLEMGGFGLNEACTELSRDRTRFAGGLSGLFAKLGSQAPNANLLRRQLGPQRLVLGSEVGGLQE